MRVSGCRTVRCETRTAIPGGRRDGLRLLREHGLVRIRHTELAALRRAVSLSPAVPGEGVEGRGARAIEQVAEEILELCQPTAGRACSDAVWPELAREIRMEGRCGAARFPVTIHVEPVELLRDVDVVIAPTNVYLEMPQPYKASCFRCAARRRGGGWTALEREIPRDNTWAIHFVTHQQATAEVIVAGISRSGGATVPGHDGQTADLQHR